MTIELAVLPGLLLIVAQLGALSAFGFVIVRVSLRQSDDCMALAQGLVVGPALWGLGANFLLHLLPGLLGMIASWAIALAIGVGLVWRARDALRIKPRAAAGVAVAALVTFWIALATRQMLGDPDPIHLGIAASVRQGAWPPVIPWNPVQPAPYHYGVDLLIGMLSPPFGPDPAFTTELMGAFAWTGLVLVLGTSLLRGERWLAALVLMPLLLTAGSWTLYSFDQPPNIVSVALPAGIPQAGIGNSLADIYWPSVEFPWTSVVEASPANILNPSFTFAYALAFVALERTAESRTLAWPAAATVAVLIGFLGLVDETIALIVLGLWFLLAAASFVQTPSPRRREDSLRAATGLGLATLLLAIGGGVLTGVLTGATGGELSLAWMDDPGSRRPIGSITRSAGGVAVLGLNVLPVALAAVVLAPRSRLTFALVGGSVVALLAALTLHYEFAEHDVVRLDGHARNLALMALLIALGIRLSALKPRRGGGSRRCADRRSGCVADRGWTDAQHCPGAQPWSAACQRPSRGTCISRGDHWAIRVRALSVPARGGLSPRPRCGRRPRTFPSSDCDDPSHGTPQRLRIPEFSPPRSSRRPRIPRRGPLPRARCSATAGNGVRSRDGGMGRHVV